MSMVKIVLMQKKTIPAVAEVLVVDASADGNPRLSIVEEGEGTAWAVIWPGMGATERSMHRISLASEGRTIPLRHPSEAVYYVISGAARVLDLADGSVQEIGPGSMVHVEAGTDYRFVADEAGAELVGGPCPPDPALYEDPA